MDRYQDTDDGIEMENHSTGKTKRRLGPTIDLEDREDSEQWWEERGQRGRKPRDKAGGRHQKNRSRRSDD